MNTGKWKMALRPEGGEWKECEREGGRGDWNINSLSYLPPGDVRDLRCQNVTSKHGGDRYGLLAFTEQGVAMLSGILKSERADAVNIALMRAFSSGMAASMRVSKRGWAAKKSTRRGRVGVVEGAKAPGGEVCGGDVAGYHSPRKA